VQFNPIFRDFNQIRCRYRVAKGSAGSGKSVNVAQDFILKLMDKHNIGANLLVVRKIDESNRDSTYAELTSAIYKICGSEALAYWRMGTSPLELESKITGNKIIFRGMKDDGQREKVKSVSFAKGKLTWVWLEEATELDEADVDILDDRLRGELDNPNLYYQMTLTFNPVSINHWIKGKYFDIPNPDVFTHHSTYLDNRFIDEAYRKRMMLRKATDPNGYRVYGEGNWGITGGQFFNTWSDDLHICEPFAIPKDWIKFRSMDWGSYHPYAVGWFAVDYDGRLYMYRELYGYGGKPNIGTKESARQVAENIVEAEPKNEEISYGVLDNACWNSPGTDGPSIAEEINLVLLKESRRLFIPCVKGRAQMAEQVRLRLDGHKDSDGKQIPGLTFFKNCIHSIRTIPNLAHDKHDPEKVDTNGEDHCFIAGTKVNTSRGIVPIELLSLNDKVLTREGYKQIKACGCTNVKATTYTLLLSDGMVLTGTGNHPVWIVGKGFVNIADICEGDGVLVCQDIKQKQQNQLLSMELHTTDTRTQIAGRTEFILDPEEAILKRDSDTCIKRFGNIITALFQKAITFITKMKIHLTMNLITLNVSLVKTIYQNMLKNMLLEKNIWTKSENLQVNGIVQKKVENGIAKWLKTTCKKCTMLQRLNACVFNVEKSMMSFLFTKPKLCFVQENVLQSIGEKVGLITKLEPALSAGMSLSSINTVNQKPVLTYVAVLSVVRNEKKHPVYNLSVSDTPEYFANGILVHNCYDMTGYACLSRPYTPQMPESEKPHDRYRKHERSTSKDWMAQ
jgi:phage terminase large subunit